MVGTFSILKYACSHCCEFANSIKAYLRETREHVKRYTLGALDIF